MYVLDGNWKLCYAHCMFPVKVEIPGYEEEINYPDVCPRNPEYQSCLLLSNERLKYLMKGNDINSILAGNVDGAWIMKAGNRTCNHHH